MPPKAGWRSPTSSCRGSERRRWPQTERREAHRVDRGEPTPRGIRREKVTHLRLLGATLRVTAAEPPDELAQPEVSSGDLVEATLAVQREALDGPAADPGHRTQPPPGALVIGAPQID